MLSAEQIQTRVAAMAGTLISAYAGKTVGVLALMDDSLFFVADLATASGGACAAHTLSASELSWWHLQRRWVQDELATGARFP
ncbi:MAG: hypothetical protein IPK32_26425 [Verrucomicrobiaceae bacterium]|nr:hypothetical protein [Verrucomicrobiaceae bacterium]